MQGERSQQLSYCENGTDKANTFAGNFIFDVGLSCDKHYGRGIIRTVSQQNKSGIL